MTNLCPNSVSVFVQRDRAGICFYGLDCYKSGKLIFFLQKKTFVVLHICHWVVDGNEINFPIDLAVINFLAKLTAQRGQIEGSVR